MHLQIRSDNKTLSKLKESPLFNLSLSSKELFHSNFLAWLWECYPEEMYSIFKSKLVNCQQKMVFEEVLREDHNLDLTIRFKDGYRIIIENKVKSLPYKDQLQEYSDKLKKEVPKTDFVLLSLTKPSFLDNGKETITLEGGFVWHWMSYFELANGLRTFSNTDEYHHLLLLDYINFIEQLSDLVQSCQIHWDSDVSFWGQTSKHISEDTLRELRIYDLVNKIRYAELAGKVRDKIQVECYPITNWHQNIKAAGQVFIGSGMTRSMGLLDLKYVVLNKLDDGKDVAIVGIQLQGNSFRLYFEQLSDGNGAKRIALALLKSRLWFHFDLEPELKEITREYPIDSEGFNRFAPAFYYRSKNLKDISPKRLAEIIITYFNTIHQNLGAISSIIKNAQ